MRHPGPVKILLATVAVLALTGLSGCGGQGGSEGPSTGFLDDAPSAVVQGRLLTVDGEGKNPRPSSGSVILSGGQGAEVRTEVGGSGTFEVMVNPGTYKVTGTSPQPDGGTAQCAAKSPVTTVSDEAPTTVDVLCFVQ